MRAKESNKEDLMEELKQRILGVLAQEGTTIDADVIATTIGASSGEVRTALEKMDDAGQITMQYQPPLVSLAQPVHSNQPMLF
jgi:DNA-binding GntR family transcriptional regulator